MKVPELAARLIAEVKDGKIRTRGGIQDRKIKLCGELGLKRVPSNSEILAEVADEDRNLLLPLLIKKPMRTASGTAVVAVMSSPHPCPHGKCTFCPGGVEQNSPQSYTGKEPAARRAGRNEYDPYLQVRDRIEQLTAIGHDTSKIDLIVMGGTFTCRDWDYQEWFVKRCFDAMNEEESPNLEAAKDLNEHAKHKCVALAVETRPDSFDEEEAENVMKLGATRIELGVQILDDGILEAVNRGHDIQDIINATRMGKTSGLPVGYHVMPGLPDSDPEKDIESFERIFSDPDFRPDSFKFYTTLVIPGTRLYDMWEAGEYEPYDTETATVILSEMKTLVPGYVRIQRIQRDIPTPEIAAGIMKSNLRQIVRDYMNDNGMVCNCLRCREVGHKEIDPVGPDEATLEVFEYEASGGKEFFISYEYGGAVIAYLRLRIDGDVASVREVKVSGTMSSPTDADSWHDKGYDTLLMEEAERIVSESDVSLFRVTCGPGDRGFYRKLGFELQRPYMTKTVS